MNNNGILTINTQALASNYATVKAISGETEIGVMLKANSYGIGADIVLNTLYPLGARNFFVAYLDEAVKVKKFAQQDNINIYVLQDLNKENYKIFLENDFIPVLNTISNVELWQRKGNNNPCIIHFDSGINRLGLKFNEVESLDFSELNILYLMSHFAEAEVEDSEYTKWQYDNFSEIISLFPENTKLSLCNSSGAFNTKHHFDMIRAGASLYGINPTPNKKNPMQEVIELKSRIIQIKHIKQGEKVGYNQNYEAPIDRTIALIGEGHADTISRGYGNNGYVYFNDVKLPIIGNVSMDLTAIDVTEVSNVINEGDYVEVIGENQSLEEFASYGGTIGYEILTLLSKRYNREIK